MLSDAVCLWGGLQDYLYWMLAALQVAAIIIYIPIARCYSTRSPHELCHDAAAMAPAAAAEPAARGMMPSEIGLTSSCTRRHAAGDTTL
jgi:hypothetical protein